MNQAEQASKFNVEEVLLLNCSSAMSFNADMSVFSCLGCDTDGGIDLVRDACNVSSCGVCTLAPLGPVTIVVIDPKMGMDVVVRDSYITMCD